MPLVDHLCALRLVAPQPHRESDAFVVERDEGFGVSLDDAQEVPASPEVVTLTLDELPGRLPRAYSGPNWTPIPVQTDHPFRLKLDTDSGAN